MLKSTLTLFVKVLRLEDTLKSTDKARKWRAARARARGGAPPDPGWMRAMVFETLQDEIRDKLDLLAELMNDNPVLDVDQTVFGLLAEVLTRLGGIPWVEGGFAEAGQEWLDECRNLYNQTLEAALAHGRKDGSFVEQLSLFEDPPFPGRPENRRKSPVTHSNPEPRGRYHRGGVFALGGKQGCQVTTQGCR